MAYLNERNIPINVLFFQVFQHGEHQLLSRTWLIDPSETQANAAVGKGTVGEKEPWNGEFYVSFGDTTSRSWDDARQYGYISAGGDTWYSQTLKLLSPVDRVWVNIPKKGYVGVGVVKQAVQPARDFMVLTDQGEQSVMDVVQHGDRYRATAEVPETQAQVLALHSPVTTSLALELLDAWMDRRSSKWLMGRRNIARSTDERSFISAVMPRIAVGHSMPLWFFNQSPELAAAFLTNMSALVFDYVVRQKLGGTNMTFGYFKQFPVVPPDRYNAADLAYIVPRLLELTHTAHDMQAWANDLLVAIPSADPRPPVQRGTPLPPFPWDPERRARLRAELDAYYARLYGLDRDELRYTLDPGDVMGEDYPSETFRVLKNNEMREFGEHRTQRLMLAAWDAAEAGT